MSSVPVRERPRGPGRPRFLRLNADLWGGGVLLLVAAVGLLLARGDGGNAWVFPRAVSGVLAVLGVGLVVKGLVTRVRSDVVERRAALVTVLPFAVGLIAYYFLLPRLGFVVTTIAAYAAATVALRGRITPRSAALGLLLGTVLALGLYQVFREIFTVPLPFGEWWEALGLED